MDRYRLDFVAVGPMKTGTSWMHGYLDAHPQVSVPVKVKETYFFTTNYEKGTDWHLSHFSERSGVLRVGEVGPTYFRMAEAADRIFEINPQCRIIVTLREPIERLLSHYSQALWGGVIDPHASLREALEGENIKEQARYFHHVSNWIRVFGQDNVAVLFYESLRDDPQTFVDELCPHIGVDPMEIPEALNTRVGEQMVPFNRALAIMSQRFGRSLRKRGFHGAVNVAKRIGVHNVFYTKQRRQKIDPGPDDIAYAFDMVIEDVQMLESSLGLDLSVWREAWARRGLSEPVSG